MENHPFDLDVRIFGVCDNDNDIDFLVVFFSDKDGTTGTVTVPDW